jgi:hypothetical protein
MKLRLPLFCMLVIIVQLLTACNFPSSSSSPTQGPDAINTAAAQTVIAMTTQFAPTPTPPGSSAPGEPTATDTPQPGVTQSSPTSDNSTVTSTPPTLAVATQIPCNQAAFVADLTYPDGTVVAPGTNFTKTWQLKNSGSCTWTTSYKLVFDSGDSLGALPAIPLSSSVAPGQTINLSVNLLAPTKARQYKGFWKLEDSSGIKFGIGPTNSAFFVVVVVGATVTPTTVSFAVTNVTTSVDDSNVTTSSCPHTFTFTAKITTSAAGTVTYYWKRSDGSHSSSETLSFSGSDTKTVTITWDLGVAGTTYNEWERVYIDNPNHQDFPKVNIKLTCN